MTITTSNKVSRSLEIQEFTANVIQFAYSNSPWSSSNMPKFTTGTVNGANAIPPSQLDSAVQPTVSLSAGLVSASQIVNALINATQRLTRIRACTCNGYYQNGSAFQLQQTLSGKAIFLPITTDNFNKTQGSTPWWSKSPNTTTMTQNLPSIDTSKFNKSNLISASNLNNFIQALRNAWNTTYNNRVTYNYYTCHTNCVSCYCARGRR